MIIPGCLTGLLNARPKRQPGTELNSNDYGIINSELLMLLQLRVGLALTVASIAAVP